MYIIIFENLKYNNMAKKESWGGPWTLQKLEAFEKYVKAYLKVMKHYRSKYDWTLVYFDGFAGSGSLGENNNNNHTLIRSLFTPQDLNVYKGAAERVLLLEEEFDYYYFVDKDEESQKKLEKKLRSLKSSKKVVYRLDDCNNQLKKLAFFLHKNRRHKALIFLDPFGMQIDWDTLLLLKESNSDLWILVPSGVVINRLLDKKGELVHMDKLVSFFGLTENEIRKCFYKENKQQSLFGVENKQHKVMEPIEKIANLYRSQLNTIYDYVNDPMPLLNSKNNTIFHFVFASNNKVAMKIAKDIIKNI